MPVALDGDDVQQEILEIYSAGAESKLSHGYEHLTELLADVEVDISRPWVEHAT